MAEMILKVNGLDAVNEMVEFLSTLTEEQRVYMLTTLEGVKLGLQLAEQSAGGGKGVSA